ncbi:hypothetical protein DL95DRAFT_418457 [Leptodontidium sp. 2 PMI_412]|nr:hypothetical protein DL95DRAFT_418457 [Leptodontidium sp. 2 PMI_412]
MLLVNGKRGTTKKNSKEEIREGVARIFASTLTFAAGPPRLDDSSKIPEIKNSRAFHEKRTGDTHAPVIFFAAIEPLLTNLRHYWEGLRSRQRSFSSEVAPFQGLFEIAHPSQETGTSERGRHSSARADPNQLDFYIFLDELVLDLIWPYVKQNEVSKSLGGNP